MSSMKKHLDWWFKDLTVRRGKYVIAEPINASLVTFTVAIILSLISYRGFWQKAFAIIAYAAIIYWGVMETKGGHSRFRKALGIMALVAVAGALALRLGIA